MAAANVMMTGFNVTTDGASKVALQIDNYDGAKTIYSNNHQYRIINGAVLAQALGVRGRTLSAETIAGLTASGWNPALLLVKSANDTRSTLVTL